MYRFGFGYYFGKSGGGGVAPIDWFNTTNVLVTNDGHSIESNGGVDSSWTARNPWSEQVSTSSLFDVSFTLDDNNNIMFGVAKMAKVANNYTDIDYCLSRQGDANLYVYENGANPFAIVGVVHGLLCRIVSDGIDVKYYYDGVLKYTSLVPPVSDFKFKASLYTNAFNNVNVINF